MKGSTRHYLGSLYRIDAGSYQLFNECADLAHHHHDFSVSS